MSKGNSCCGGCAVVSDEPIDRRPAIRSTDSELTRGDRIGRWKSRLGIRRMNYIVEPRLYRLGSPDRESPILVTANYKLTFDFLRSSLPDRNLWILVLDTKGINVWCAAKKGTFGTDELVDKIIEFELANHVDSRNLILPQLGAPGIAAHEVKSRTGFSVIYGPVRADDIPKFLDDGFRVDHQMRRVRFPIKDRAELVPLELIQNLKPTIIAIPVLFAAALLFPRLGISFFVGGVLLVIAALIAGTVLTPLLLPWIAFRPFALKGWILGLIMVAIINTGWAPEALFGFGNLLVFPDLAAFLAMNFTGASTYTSLSGVIKEMKIAVPMMIISAVAGIGFWIGGLVS
ncbi:MAG: hypothetical protein KAH21_13450 [Spirochaetaceae bacterium]|nr:hypothetical protein [Spirochaetaceae bacterium]